MKDTDYYDKSLFQFKMTFSSSELNAVQVASVVSQTATLYGVFQEYLDSPDDLKIINVSKGSFLFDFLGDLEVIDKLIKVSAAVARALESYLFYVGANMTWDLTKYFAQKIRKQTGLSLEESEKVVNGISVLTEIANKTGSVVYFNFKDNTALFISDKFWSHKNEEYSMNEADDVGTKKAKIDKICSIYLEDTEIKLPPRKTKHGKFAKKKPF